ncbi:hypothetical protein CC80DRAFT_495307 [Byssothecium circinans]|uniref:Uncharacterized protein n=1 Tax=Byssothecium circinans TaxID=147558 RepID=A0A6A5TLB2_9PLEO|nr:hypothetical protein CC80DRAFT_495307 [Byssothecium circinans]
MPDLHNRQPEYVFSYQPPEPVPEPPLLFEEELTHTFYHPRSRIWGSSDALVYSQEIYNRLPKRRGRLRCLIKDGFVYGYGVEFVEGFNFKFFIYCELFILLWTFIAVGMYAGIARGKEKSGVALAIGAFVFGFGQFLYTVVLGLAEKWEAWRY